MTNHPETITPGKLVRTDRPTALSGQCVTVRGPEMLDGRSRQSLTVDDKLAADGWQIAEHDNTGARVFVRVTGERKWVGNLLVNRVEVRAVDTIVVPATRADRADTFAIVAALGEPRPMGWTRTENVRENR